MPALAIGRLLGRHGYQAIASQVDPVNIYLDPASCRASFWSPSLPFALIGLGLGLLKPSDTPEREDSIKMTLLQIAATVGLILLIGLVITVAIYVGIATSTEAAVCPSLPPWCP